MASADREYRGTRALRLWTGWLLGPLAWALHENVSYWLAPWACGRGSSSLLHLTTLAAVALALTGCAIAWRQRRRFDPAGTPAAQRGRFMATVGLLLSAFSVVGILIEALPNVVLDPCLGIL